MNGIDISNAQATMDVAKVPADFVIIKATQGVKYINPTCDKHYQQAKAANKLLGVYHYANGGNAVDEAAFFLKNVFGYIKEAILCLDWERDLGGGYKNPLFGTPSAPQWIKAWCDEVYKQTGVKPLVYLQASALADVKGIGDYGLWVAQYADSTLTGYQDKPWNEGTYTCAIRQYSSHGRLDGYGDDLDLDKAYMDADAWHKYANPSGTPQKVEVKPAPAPQPKPQPKPTTYPPYTVREGDTLSGIAKAHGTTYQHLAQINGISNPNLIHIGQVIRFDNSAPVVDNTIHVGDNVKVTRAVTYNGTPFKLYYSTYKVMELKGDRAVIGVNGQVTAAINKNNLRKA